MNDRNTHLTDSDIAIIYDIKVNNKAELDIDNSKLIHFNHCNHCQNAFEDLKHFLLSNEYVRKQKTAKYFYLLTAAIVLAFLGYSFLLPLNEANYIPNKKYEALVGQQFRADETEIISPVKDVFYNNKIRFEWKTEMSGPFYIQIIDNQLNTINRITSSQKIIDFKIDTLKPGLFYWKLMDEYDLLYVGKFLIK